MNRWRSRARIPARCRLPDGRLLKTAVDDAGLRLGQPERNQEDGNQGDQKRRHDWQSLPEHRPAENARQGRAHDKAQVARDGHLAKVGVSVLFHGDVGEVGVCYRDISARSAVQRSREKQHQERKREYEGTQNS